MAPNVFCIHFFPTSVSVSFPDFAPPAAARSVPGALAEMLIKKGHNLADLHAEMQQRDGVMHSRRKDCVLFW